MAIVAVWLVSMGGTLPAPAQTQHAPAADTPSAEVPFGFKAYGVFSRMITERNYLAVVALKDAADGREDRFGITVAKGGQATQFISQ